MLWRKCMILVVLLLIWGTSAWADGLLDKNINYFQPVIDGSGLLLTYGSEPLTMWRMSYGLYTNDAVSPLTHVDNEDTRRVLVENQVEANLFYAVGLPFNFNVGFDLPFALYRQFNDEFDIPDAEEFAMEDMRLEVKWTALNRLQKCLGLAILGRITTPIVYRENNFVSDHFTTLSPIVVFDLGRRWWTFAANLGYKYYSNPQKSELYNLEIGDELTLQLGARFRFDRSQQVIIDSSTRTQVRAPFGEPDLDYVEILAAYRYSWQRLNYTALTAGVGMGLLQGVGNPKFRFFIGVNRDERRWCPGDVYF